MSVNDYLFQPFHGPYYKRREVPMNAIYAGRHITATVRRNPTHIAKVLGAIAERKELEKERQANKERNELWLG